MGTEETTETEEKSLSTIVRDLALVPLVPWVPLVSSPFGLKVPLVPWSPIVCLFVAKVDYYGKIFRCLKNFA